MFKSILETNGCVCVRLHLSPYFILDLETNIQSSFVSILYFRFRKIKKKQHNPSKIYILDLETSGVYSCVFICLHFRFRKIKRNNTILSRFIF